MTSEFAAVAHPPIFHYTSQRGLIGILQSRKLQLSSIRYLNDSAELKHAIGILLDQLSIIGLAMDVEASLLQEFTKEVMGYTPSLGDVEHYVGSFSQKKDLLSQWRAYPGSGVGFSIGFDWQALNDLARKRQFSLGKCNYDPKGQKKDVQTILDKAMDRLKAKGVADAVMWCVAATLILSPRMKHPSFKEEDEWRLIASEPGSPDGFREGLSTLVPYRDFVLTDEHGKTPINEIVIGPAPHMNLSAASVKALLAKEGFEEVKISHSEIPYRNW